MILAGFLGMATKYAECTLGVKYRTVHPDGSVTGRPMYYLKRGLGECGWPRLGAVLAGFIALTIILASFVSTNVYQVNQVYTQVVTVTGGAGSFFDQHAWLFGIVIAASVGGIVIGA